MGFKERTVAPLVAVSLEELVPQDHFYRHVQKVRDLSVVYELVRACYATAGRPSIDPVVFFKVHLVLCFEDLRSERRLLRQVADRLSVRWYSGYDVDEPLPDHSTLSKIRLRYGLEVFRRFFEAIVEQCQNAKLVWGRELYFDSGAASMRMLIWIPWPRVLRWRHEKRFKSTLLPCLIQNPHSLRTGRNRARTGCLPNDSWPIRAHDSLSRCLPGSLRHAARNSPRSIRLATTGLRRRADNSETCTVPTNVRRIFVAVPPILMPRRCA
jgi:transposase